MQSGARLKKAIEENQTHSGPTIYSQAAVATGAGGPAITHNNHKQYTVDHHHYVALKKPPDLTKTLASLNQAADLKSIELELPQLMSFYVPPDSVPYAESEQRVSLDEQIRAFLSSEEESVFLLLGDAGMGKTVAGLKLVSELWTSYEQQQTAERGETPIFIPLRIELKSFNETTAQGCVERTLESQGLSLGAIKQLKQSRQHRLLVIFDGLDELAGGGLPSLFRGNDLNEWPGAKMMIGCRNEYLVNYPGYKVLLGSHSGREELFERQVAPLTWSQIKAYIKSRVTLEANHVDKLSLPMVDYLGPLEADRALEALIQTPFLLKLYVEARGELVIKAGESIHRAQLYEAFIETLVSSTSDESD